MSDRNSKLLISDIIESIEKINRYTQGLNFDNFLKEEIIIDAVIRNFTIIGEATARLPKIFKSGNKNIPWVKIKNFRNLLTHEYFGVDLKITWKIIETELPFLYTSLREIYKSMPDSLFDSQ